MDHPVPSTEQHRWLHKLVGDWTFESVCNVGPDKPPMVSQGRESVRTLGELWAICEMTGENDGKTWNSVMTLGCDPGRGIFIGTFVASVMPHLWLYHGSLDEAKSTLSLAAEGPSMTGTGNANYQDEIAFQSDDERTLTSFIEMAPGHWVEFMKQTYRRSK